MNAEEFAARLTREWYESQEGWAAGGMRTPEIPPPPPPPPPPPTPPLED